MAIVQIPMGGGMIGIEVPDFAMESTQQDLLSYSQQQVNILNAIATNAGITTNTIQNTSQQTIANANKNSQQQTVTFLGGVKNILGAGYKTAISAATGIQQDTKASELTEKLFAGMNLPDLGAGMGTVIGIVEEFANQMSTLNRVGAGLGQNFIQLREDAANIGLGLDQYTKIVANSGATMNSLGSNTEQGSNRFIKFTAALRSATQEAGYFGMGSQEMAQFTADELELRRQMYGTEYNRNLNEKDLAAQLKENLMLQSAMARITGQDVQDRIKAQQDFRRDAIGASVMSKLTKEQQVAMDAANGAMTQFGPMQKLMTDSFRNIVAGLPAPEEFYTVAALLGDAGLDIISEFENLSGQVQAAAPADAIQAQLDSLAGQFKNIDTSNIDVLAMAGGPDAALTILEGKLGAVASGATTMEDSTAKINTAMSDFATAVADGTLKMQGAAANVEEFMAESKALAVNSILESVGIDVTNIEAFQTGFAGLSDSLTNLPDNETFRTLVSTALQTAFQLNGVTAVVGVALDSQGVQRTTGSAEKLAEKFMIGALVAQAAGNEKVAAAMRKPMETIVTLQVLDAAGQITGIQAMSDAAQSVEGVLDYFVTAVGTASTSIYEAINMIPPPLPPSPTIPPSAN